MNVDSGAKVRGTVIKVPDSTPGLLFVNGAQKSFALEGVWKSPLAPAGNMVVEVEMDAAGAITAISAVDSQQIAKERLNQLSGAAQQQGKQAAELASQGVGALAARMGKVALVTAVLVWIAWFLLPAASVSMFVINKSFTFWDLLGMDLSNPMTLSNSSHGLLAFIGLAAIIAPFVVPFRRSRSAQLLNAAPLLFLTFMGLKTWWDIQQAIGQTQPARVTDPLMAQFASQMTQSAIKAMTDAISIGAGAYVLVLASLVLATQAFRSPRSARA